jgi:4-aminobutyrate aminotransferase-like enzyme
VEIVKPEGGKPNGALAGRIINAMKERGVLIGAAGPYGQVLKIRPPLPFSCGNAETLLDALGDALKQERSLKRRKKP